MNDLEIRKQIEKRKIEVFFPDMKERKDPLRQTDSGFNEIIGRIASKNKIRLGIDLSAIQGSKEQKAKILGRIMQNIRIARKTNTKLTIKGMKDYLYPMLSLGASTSQVRDAQYF